uniref:MADF domain-containing protein n=1 Tax=Steinernema glaseri TaxID=37863 RepID=A0A1I7ZCN5_9BILA
MEWTDEQRLRLIELVQKHPPLWNASDEEHKNRQMVELIWTRIYDKSDLNDHPLEDVRKQWKNLRDSFFKQKRRVDMQFLEGKDDFCLPKWKFFSKLLFLAPEFEEKYSSKLSHSARHSPLPSTPSPALKRPSTSLEESYETSTESSSVSDTKRPKRDFDSERFSRFGQHVADTLLMITRQDVDAAVELEIDMRQAMLNAIVRMSKKASEKSAKQPDTKTSRRGRRA